MRESYRKEISLGYCKTRQHLGCLHLSQKKQRLSARIPSKYLSAAIFCLIFRVTCWQCIHWCRVPLANFCWLRSLVVLQNESLCGSKGGALHQNEARRAAKFFLRPPPLIWRSDPPLILMQAPIEVVLGYDCCVMIHDSRLITGHSSPSQLYSINRGCMVPTFFLLRGGGRSDRVSGLKPTPHSSALSELFFGFVVKTKLLFFRRKRRKFAVPLSCPCP